MVVGGKPCLGAVGLGDDERRVSSLGVPPDREWNACGRSRIWCSLVGNGHREGDALFDPNRLHMQLVAIAGESRRLTVNRHLGNGEPVQIEIEADQVLFSHRGDRSNGLDVIGGGVDGQGDIVVGDVVATVAQIRVEVVADSRCSEAANHRIRRRRLCARRGGRRCRCRGGGRSSRRRRRHCGGCRATVFEHGGRTGRYGGQETCSQDAGAGHGRTLTVTGQ